MVLVVAQPLPKQKLQKRFFPRLTPESRNVKTREDPSHLDWQWLVNIYDNDVPLDSVETTDETTQGAISQEQMVYNILRDIRDLEKRGML